MAPKEAEVQGVATGVCRPASVIVSPQIKSSRHEKKLQGRQQPFRHLLVAPLRAYHLGTDQDADSSMV